MAFLKRSQVARFFVRNVVNPTAPCAQNERTIVCAADSFTLRGKAKVNAQWQLFTIVHNIEKIAHVARRA